MFLDTTKSMVFGSGEAVMEATLLKNPNQLREAVVFERLSNLPRAKRAEFIRSREAKIMVENDIISQDSLDRLASDLNNTTMNTAVCHMAKEENNPLWDELVRCRMEERRLMNELILQYGEKVDKSPAIKNIEAEFINKSIPEYFRT